MSEAKAKILHSIPELHKGDIFTAYQLDPGGLMGGEELKFVSLGQDKLNPDLKFAVKITLRNGDWEEKKLTEQFQNEVTVMAQLQHPHVVALEWAASFPGHHALVMELCPYGPLSGLIGRMGRGQMDNYFMQISQGLQYIHSQNIVHRDLKLDNILIGYDSKVKIADFDLSVSLKPGQSMVQYRMGTLPYMAPEMLKNPLGSYNGFKLDTYALGVVFWCIWFQHNVKEHRDYLTIVGKYAWPTSFHGYRNVLENLLMQDPESRWSVEQLMSKLSEAPWVPTVALPLPSPVASESDSESSPPSPPLSLSSTDTPDRQH